MNSKNFGIMENERIIRIREVCTHYNLEPEFISRLRDYGLLTVVSKEEDEFVDESRLADLETILHLHYDLEINLEGIDAISHMLKRMREMQKELTALRNRLG
jgi:hypothetical protein